MLGSSKRILLILILCLCSISLPIVLLYPKTTPHSPLASSSPAFINSPETDSSFIHYAFLPFWNLSDVSAKDIDPFTHLSYFSLTLDENGSILTRTTPTQTEPGWNNFRSTTTQSLLNQARSNGIQTEIAFTMATDENIVNFLASPSAQQIAISEITNILDQYQLTGINIDFEPDRPVNSTVAAQFTQFIKLLHDQIQNQPAQITLSIDIYPSAAKGNNIWQLEELSPFADYFIVMTYDYYRASSTHAGPVAPLYQNHSTKYIMSHLKQINDKIPSSQIILGLPLYGYQWQTVSNNYYSPTYPKTGFSISLKKIQDLIQNEFVSLNWNSETLSHWLSFSQNQQTYQIHFDSIETLKLKVDLARSSQLAGVAYWAVGYQPANFPKL